MNKESASPQDVVRRTLRRLSGKSCWHVSCGRNVGSSFEFALGRKIGRKIPFDNESQPISFQRHQPEYALMVWCAWRLSKDGQIIAASSDFARDEKFQGLLRRLSDQKIARLQSLSPFYDLKILFSGGWRLDIFCDRGAAKPGTNTHTVEKSNWEIFAQDSFLLGV